MKIQEIKIKERVWNQELEKYEEKINIYTRENYCGNFDCLIMENIHKSTFTNYAESEYDLIEEDVFAEECNKRSVEDIPDKEILEYLEDRGFIVFKTNSISEAMEVKKIKETLKL